MILSRPPVVTFVQDDSRRLQVVSVQMRKSHPKTARSAGKKPSSYPPNSRLGDLPIQSADEYCQFAPPHMSNFKNKPQSKSSFRRTR